MASAVVLDTSIGRLVFVFFWALSGRRRGGDASAPAAPPKRIGGRLPPDDKLLVLRCTEMAGVVITGLAATGTEGELEEGTAEKGTVEKGLFATVGAGTAVAGGS